MEETQLTSKELRDLLQYQLVREHSQNLLTAINGLLEAQGRWNALDSSANMIDGQGAFFGLTRVELGSVIFDTANALNALLDQGHRTNLEKVA